MKTSPLARDRYALYEASVQGVEYELKFCERVYRALRGRPFRRLREDFCATAALGAAWVLRHPDATAVGVDLDPVPLAWAERYRLARMGRLAKRLRLVRGDVRTARVPKADVTVALNFSYWVFKEREELLAYFRSARRGLARDGLLVLNAFGGFEAMREATETKRIAASQTVDGLRLPAFRYIWEQESFNPVTNEILCSIHFELAGRRRMRRAFVYDWRLWSPPELRELLLEAGFREVRTYFEGWDEKARTSDGRLRLKRKIENQDIWLAYVVAAI
ncbi:MAG: SAM-dependent methyltransferase [Candidatus Eiseniibacteriota bacterium]